MNYSNSVIALLSCLLLVSCEPRWNYGEVDFEPQIVVEGWIENGQVPYVCLTQTKTLDMKLDSLALSDVPIRWAKVTVSDGINTEVLTGRMDQNLTPPFVYTGSQIQGEVGKTYTLTVEYSGRVVTAVTTIPAPVKLNGVNGTKCADSDTLYQINASLSDNPGQKNYYKFFTSVVGRDKRFYSAFMGTIDDGVLMNDTSFLPVYRGMRDTNKKKFTPFFKIGDCVLVKFTQLSKEGFDFWSSYENAVSNGKNPIFPSSKNLKTNIKGGLGIWCGYGANTYMVRYKQED